MLHRIENINSLKFQACRNSSLWRFQAKESSFSVTFNINALFIKINQKQLFISKEWLNIGLTSLRKKIE